MKTCAKCESKFGVSIPAEIVYKGALGTRYLCAECAFQETRDLPHDSVLWKRYQDYNQESENKEDE